MSAKQPLDTPYASTPEAMRRYQNEALKRYISEKVLPNSKHYQRLFAEHNLSAHDISSVEDLARFPLTSKADLAATLEAPQKSRDFLLIPDEERLKKQPKIILQALLRGKQHVKDALNREFRPIFMTSTTGRSAEPLPFFYTDHDLKNLGHAGSRLIQIAEARPDDRIVNMFPYAPHLAYWFAHYAATTSNLFCVSSGGGKVMGTEGNLRLIEKIKPSVLVGMPTFVYHVMQIALDEGKTISNLRTIVLGGEKVAEGTRRRLSQMAAELGSPGVKVMATYGFTEAKIAWPECPHTPGEESSGYHLYPDMGIMEIVDPKTGEQLPEGTPGEIVYTPLKARGTVALRYRTGDYSEGGLVTGICPRCGRFTQRLTGRISRSSEIRSMQLRKLKGTLVDFNQLEHVLDGIEALGTWQLELRKKNDDPLELDELILHASLKDSSDKDKLCQEVNTRFTESVEIKPNRIYFHSAEAMRTRQKVGVAMKEEKIVDNRTAPSAATPKAAPIGQTQ